MLVKKLLRDIWRAKGQFMAAFVVVCLGVTFYTGLNSISRNLKSSSEKYYSDYNLADLEITGLKLPVEVLGEIGSLPNVKDVYGRVELEARIKSSGSNTNVTLITLPETRKAAVNDVIVEGRYFTGKNIKECLVEQAYFNAHGLKAGDTLKFTSGGIEDILVIIGSARSPEFVYQLRDPSQMIPDNFKFGVVYINEIYAGTILGSSDYVNSVCITLKNTAETKTAKNSIEKLIKRYGTAAITERKDQMSYKMLLSELEQLVNMGNTIPFIFFGTAVAVLYILVSRLIENQRTQIGMLKALGYKDSEVLLHYIGYPIIIGAAGYITGILLGVALGKYMTAIENQYYHMPIKEMFVYWDLVLKSVAATFAFCLAAGYISCKNVLIINPAEAMRAKAPRIGKKILLERCKKFWSKLTFNWKLTFRNMFRYKKRTAMSAAGIILSTAMIVVGFGIMDSINFMIDQYLLSSLNYDLKIIFSKFVPLNELGYVENIGHVKSLEPLLQTGVKIENGPNYKNVMLTGIVKDPELFLAVDKSGTEAEIPNNGLLLPERIAGQLGAAAGKYVKVKSYLPGQREKYIKVSGILDQYVSFTSYAELSVAGELLSEQGAVNSAVIKLDSKKNIGEVEDELYDIPAVKLVETKDDNINNLRKFMNAMMSFSVICVISSAALAVAIVYNISSINIFERRNDFAAMKMLGLQDTAIRRLLYGENFIISAVSSVLGLPIGYLLNIFVLNMVKTDEFTIPNDVINTKTYFIAIVLIFCFTWAANVILRRKIDRVDMVEALKSRE